MTSSEPDPVAELSPRFHCSGTGPLAGIRVLVPRAMGQAEALAVRIAASGGEAVVAPVLRIEPGDARAMRQAVRELRDGRFAAVVVTSANAVAALVAGCDAEDIDPPALGRSLAAAGCVIAAVGAATGRALTGHLGVAPTLVPDRATGSALGAAFPPGAGRVLVPRGDLASDELPRRLRANGYEPVPVVAYRTVVVDQLPPAVLAAVDAGEVRFVALTSPSTVRGLAGVLGPPPWPMAAVSIGPVTTTACRELGLEVVAEADPHDVDGLIAALETAVAR
jgi:uroporphyrinogen-III synthase